MNPKYANLKFCAEERKFFEDLPEEYKNKAMKVLNQLETTIHCENILDENYLKGKTEIETMKDQFVNYLDYLRIFQLFPTGEPMEFEDWRNEEWTLNV